MHEKRKDLKRLFLDHPLWTDTNNVLTSFSTIRQSALTTTTNCLSSEGGIGFVLLFWFNQWSVQLTVWVKRFPFQLAGSNKCNRVHWFLDCWWLKCEAADLWDLVASSKNTLALGRWGEDTGQKNAHCAVISCWCVRLNAIVTKTTSKWRKEIIRGERQY